MTVKGAALVGGVTDGDGCLIAAEEPLATLQLQCGGELPGIVAVPALLEVVKKAQRYQLKLGRNISARNADEEITAWVEVEPRSDGEPGCDIRIGEWHVLPLLEDNENALAAQRETIDRQLAGLSAILDDNQRLLTVSCLAPDLNALHEQMSQAIGQYWTDFIPVEGISQRGPVHWRLLDGVKVYIDESDREWRVALLPVHAAGGAIEGFELLLIPDQPLQSDTGVDAPQPEPESAQIHMIGDEVAPVLRRPISRIIANAETIRARLAGPLADEYAQYAADINHAGKHLLGLLEDLSDLEVVEADNFTTVLEPMDLADAARQAAGILSAQATEKNIIIDPPRYGETLPAKAEFCRVLQILLNLIGNAVRYSPKDSQIWIRLEDDWPASRVIVADQWPGMSDEQSAVIFEKFERLGRNNDGGSGLGLYISRKLARVMGGDVTVESAPGHVLALSWKYPLSRLINAVSIRTRPVRNRPRPARRR